MLQRTRLQIRYDARSTRETTEREISPQRLIHYRDHWHLDAWCHLRQGLRIFSVDRIDNAETLKVAPIEIEDAVLDEKLGKSYGLFSGAPVAIAMLLFTPRRALWIGPELWHPDQKSWYEPSGHYVLEVPYSLPDELILDIMRHGAEVEVLAPLDLRQAVAGHHRAFAVSTIGFQLQRGRMGASHRCRGRASILVGFIRATVLRAARGAPEGRGRHTEPRHSR